MGDEADHDAALEDVELGYDAAGVMGFCMNGHQVITAGYVESCIECGAPVRYEPSEEAK